MKLVLVIISCFLVFGCATATKVNYIVISESPKAQVEVNGVSMGETPTTITLECSKQWVGVLNSPDGWANTSGKYEVRVYAPKGFSGQFQAKQIDPCQWKGNGNPELNFDLGLAKKPKIQEEKPTPSISEIPIVKSDVDELPAIKAKPNKNSYAIVIGIEQYRQKLPKADFATHDAQTVTEYLTKVMGYPEENVVTLLNDKASLSDITKYFEKWLWNNVEKDGTVFIYYSGHGAPNPKTGDAYLVPYDGDPSFIDETGYSLKRLYESLGKLQAKEIVVALDSCFSGAGGRSVLAKGARPLVMTMEKSVVPSNVAVLSAASGEQISSTYEEKGHGLFTYFMLKGLKGEGDTNGDGKVEIGEIFEYIKPQVERIARKAYNNEQLPQLIAPAETIRQKLIER